MLLVGGKLHVRPLVPTLAVVYSLFVCLHRDAFRRLCLCTVYVRLQLAVFCRVSTVDDVSVRIAVDVRTDSRDLDVNNVRTNLSLH